MSARLYRLLLLAFPRRMRREMGDDMARMFEAHLRQARASGASLTGLWLLAIADAVFHGAAERGRSMVERGRSLARAGRHWRWAMRGVKSDLRYACRMLVRQPGVTATAVLTLALGIGANTAIFSAVDALLLRPLPYDDPDRLMMVWEKREAESVFDNVVAPADFVDWARMNTTFESMAALATTTADLTGSGEPLRLDAGQVSTAFFDVLRVRPLFGRTFRVEDGVVGRHHVVVLGHGLWRRQFGGEASIVGRDISLNGVPHQIVGVLPASFEYPDSALELWKPLPLEGGTTALSRASHELYVYGRVRAGITLAQARADLDRVGRQLSQEYPRTNARHGALVTALREEIAAPVRPALWLLFGAVAFVLLIACVNVANLLLARSVGRRREMGIRAALGASTTRLASQALTESLVLGLCGGVAGLAVAYWGIQALKRLVPERAAVLGLEQVGLDLRVLGFALGVSLCTSVLFGLLPAWHLARHDVNGALQDGGRAAGPVRRRLRLALVASEIALASLLLVAAGLALRSVSTLLRVPAGFDAADKLTAQVALAQPRYSDAAVALATSEDIERRFAAMPGVRAVGVTSHLPLSGEDGRRGVVIEGREATPGSPTRAHTRVITPGYLRAMGLQLAAGRPFSDTDRTDAPRVAIVNETMARRYWPGGSPIGKRVAFTGSNQWREVVGIVRDVRHWGLAMPVNPELYLPLRQMPWWRVTYVMATDLEPAALAGPVREALRAVDLNLPLSRIRTMNEVAARSMATERAVTSILGVFGVIALLLAAAGIYGVMTHLVSLRTAEIGVRMTLGARPTGVLLIVLAEGLLQAAIGLALGLSVAVGVMGLFRRMLYGVGPADPATLVSVATLMLCAALVACVVPARRAMRVDPVTALRQ